MLLEGTYVYLACKTKSLRILSLLQCILLIYNYTFNWGHGNIVVVQVASYIKIGVQTHDVIYNLSIKHTKLLLTITACLTCRLTHIGKFQAQAQTMGCVIENVPMVVKEHV